MEFYLQPEMISPDSHLFPPDIDSTKISSDWECLILTGGKPIQSFTLFLCMQGAVGTCIMQHACETSMHLNLVVFIVIYLVANYLVCRRCGL